MDYGEHYFGWSPRVYGDNPPKENELTIVEREEFFAGQDARAEITHGLSGNPINMEPFCPSPQTNLCGDSIAIDLSSVPRHSPIEWSTGLWNGPMIHLSPDDPFGDMYRIFNPGIHVTSIVPPAQGWPVAMYCPLCKETTFLLSPWAIKPTDGDYFKLNDTCASECVSDRHNITLAIDGTNRDTCERMTLRSVH